MPLVTESYLNMRGSETATTMRESARTILKNASKAAPTTQDIFLSHSVLDAQLVLGAKHMFELHGLTVYVDWLDDPHLDRSSVTRETAVTLRKRMRLCKGLVYLYTENSTHSKWMPWELGLADGLKSKVAILPAVAEQRSRFRGTEYLGVYPYIDRTEDKGGKMRLWVNDGDNYAMLPGWLRGTEQIRSHSD